MNKTHIISMFLSLILGAIFFVATDNIILSILILLLSLAASLLLYIPRLSRYEKLTKRFHECFHFINNFIISLSIKKAIEPAIENTVLTMGDEFVEMVKSFETLSGIDKLKKLSENYFPFHLYKLFIFTISLYEEEGGNILESSKYLLNSLRLEEEKISQLRPYIYKKYFNFATLWGITLAILVLLKFTLGDLYKSIKSQPVFLISLIALALFILLSLYILILRATYLDIKGYNKNEKII